MFSLFLVFSLFSSVSSAASEDLMTVEEYISYLKDKTLEDPKAQETLNQFLTLTKEDQVKFVEFLFSDEFYESIAYSTKANGTVKKVVNGIPVETKSDLATIITGEGNKTVTGSYILSVFGVQTTTLSVSVQFNYDTSTGDATRVLDQFGSLSNFNPALVWSHVGDAAGRIEDNRWAWARQSFESRINLANGTQVDTWHVYVLGHDWDNWKKLESTHPNFDGVGEATWEPNW